MRRGPKFDLVATATLGLAEVHDSIKSQDLVLENLGTSVQIEFRSSDRCDVTRACVRAENPCHQLPLFDHFCCRLAAQPDCASAELTASVALKCPSAKTKGKSCKTDAAFAVLRGFTLDIWKKKEHREKGRSPLVSSSLAQVAVSCPALPEASSNVFLVPQSASLTHGPERGEVAVVTFEECEERRVEFRCPDAPFVSALSQRIADSQA